MQQIKLPKVIPNITSYSIEECRNWTNILSEFSNEIHLDVMDGIYVETKSPPLVELLEMTKDYSVDFNIHLMTENPNKDLSSIAGNKNIKLVYIHIEKANQNIINRRFDFKLGLVIRPDTEIEKYKELLKHVSTVMVMPIMPGRMGNPFIPEALEKINQLRSLGFQGEIHIDGHVNKESLKEILNYKPDVLNVGSAISKSISPKGAYTELNELVKEYIC